MNSITAFTIDELISKINSTEAMPGGGSVSALVSGMAAGLCGMTAKLTLGKKGYEVVEGKMKDYIKKVDKLIEELKQLADEDPLAFGKVLKAYKLPKDAEEDIGIREKAIQDALIDAALVPLEISEKSIEIIEIALLLIEEGNKNVIADGAGVAHLAYAAVQISAINAKINIVSIKDEHMKQQIEDRTDKLIMEAESKKKKLVSAINNNILS